MSAHAGVLGVGSRCKLLETCNEVTGLAGRERCVEPVLEGAESGPRSNAELGRREVVVRELGQRFTSPEQESLVEKPPRRLGIPVGEVHPRLRAEGLESIGVDLASPGPKRVTVRMRDQDPAVLVVAEQLPELRDVHANDLRRRRGGSASQSAAAIASSGTTSLRRMKRKTASSARCRGEPRTTTPSSVATSSGPSSRNSTALF